MGTILFDSIVFGPVKSRRLGHSLGINLLPNDSKLCNYNCIYCECGWTFQNQQGRSQFHPIKEVLTALEEKLNSMKASGEVPDSITFAGNGEPTLHPDFPEIVDGVIELRNKYYPSSKVAVLSNGTTLQNSRIFEALDKVDRNMLKLDSAIESTYKLINNPPASFSLERLIDNLDRFEGEFIIQTLFLKGEINGIKFDNTSSKELDAWLKLVVRLNPTEVHVYSLARETPSTDLIPATSEELNHIGKLLEERKIKAFVFS